MDEVIAGEKTAFSDVPQNPQLSNTTGASYGNPQTQCNQLLYYIFQQEQTCTHTCVWGGKHFSADKVISFHKQSDLCLIAITK